MMDRGRALKRIVGVAVLCCIVFVECRIVKRRIRLYDSGKYDIKDTVSYCSKLVKLNRRQLAFCRKKPKVVRVLEEGFNKGINACVEKFKNNSHTRWNCTNRAKLSKSNVFFGIPLAVGTKEAAVMHAFGSVGMFLTLTKQCINGNIRECPADKMFRTCYGAGDSSKSCSVINWEMPRKLFFSFMLSTNRGKYWRNPNRFMARFNSLIGIVAVVESTIKGCHCSRRNILTSPCLATSSCTEQLPVLEDVSTYLMDKYVKAKSFNPVKPVSSAVRATYPPEISGGKTVFIKESKIPPEISGKDLVYYMDSPLYCEPKKAFHWGGIGGRPCRPDVKAFDSCNILCCGFGYMIMPEIVKKNCKITLTPKLSIKCETLEVYKYYCKYVWMVRRRDKRGWSPLSLPSMKKTNVHLLKQRDELEQDMKVTNNTT